MRVKICGITSYADAAIAVECGADALGFNFHPTSPRYIRPADTRCITKKLPPFISSVGLFVDVADPLTVDEMAREAGVQMVQLHGNESTAYCRRLPGWLLIKALRPGNASFDSGLGEYPVTAFLLDAWDPVLRGGTGRTFDWSLAAGFCCGKPLILAGGLTQENVAEAIRMVKPFAVDVCSGVESEPGKKDKPKVEAFIREARNAGIRF